MSALLGPIGHLERMQCSSQLRVAKEPRHTFIRTLGGARRAHRFPASRRVWDVQVGTAKPEQWNMLEQIYAGLMPGAMVWYDELAQVTNILPPELSMCTGPPWVNGEQGGSRSKSIAPDGARFLRSVQGPPQEWITMPMDVPVLEEHDVSVSAYLTGHGDSPARLRVQELDPELVVVKDHEFTTEPGAVLQRVVAQIRTLHRTVALRVSCYNVLTLALPAITLTKTAYDWAAGRGCFTAVVDVHGEDVQLAVESPTDWGRRSSHSFTITELG